MEESPTPTYHHVEQPPTPPHVEHPLALARVQKAYSPPCDDGCPIVSMKQLTERFATEPNRSWGLVIAANIYSTWKPY